MFSQRGFSAGSQASTHMHVKLIGCKCELAVCLEEALPMKWGLFQGVTLSSPNDSLETL